MTRARDPVVSLSLSTEEALALRHLFVWLQGLEKEAQSSAYLSQFTLQEREIHAGLRQLLVEYGFR